MENNKLSVSLFKRARTVKLLLLDCDGVLTDGKLYFSKDGEELKAFHVHDGMGISLWHDAGFVSGVITGRESGILGKRVKELGIHYVMQKSRNKVDDFQTILRQSGVTQNEVAYIGDDLPDLGLLEIVGFPVLVADAAIKFDSPDVYITTKSGGCGAIREVVDLILKAKSSEDIK